LYTFVRNVSLEFREFHFLCLCLHLH